MVTLPSFSMIDSDDGDINVLEETLLKVDSLTDQITSSLHNLGLSAIAAEYSIKPIAGKAKMLTIYEQNIEASIGVVDGIKDYAVLTTECGQVIDAGPEAVGIPKYSHAIQRLDNAIKELHSSNLQTFSKVVDKADSLKRRGILNMKDYVRTTLAKAFEPIDAGEYLSNNRLFPILPTATVTTLRQLYAFFQNDQRERVDDVYFEIASRYISASLSGLSTASVPSIPDTPSNSMLISGATVGAPGNGTQVGGFGSVSIAGMYERGSNAITKYADAYCRLMIGEVTNARQLFDNGDGTSSGNGDMGAVYFEQIMTLTINEFIEVSTKINDHVSRNMQTDSALGFELLEAVTNVSNVIKKFSTRVPARLTQIMTSCQNTTHGLFKDFIKYIETRVDSAQSNVIVENGVSDATVDVMSRLKRLSLYKSIALVSISTLGPGNWITSSTAAPVVPATAGAPGAVKKSWNSVYSTSFLAPQGTKDPVELLSWYFSDCIDALFVCLEIKAKGLQKKNTQVGFFLLTNLALIEHYVTSSDIYKILGSVGAERLEKLKKRGVDLFLEGWKNAASLLMDVTVVKGPPGKGLSSKDREAIKEKFRTFNTEFEQLTKSHKAYNITNQTLRQQLAKEVKFILPLYHRYYDKHVGGDFTKHVDKYIKYNKQEFDKILESLE